MKSSKKTKESEETKYVKFFRRINNCIYDYELGEYDWSNTDLLSEKRKDEKGIAIFHDCMGNDYRILWSTKHT